MFFDPKPLLEHLSGAFPPLYERLRALNPNLISGKITPKWQDFSELEDLLNSVRMAKHSLFTPEAKAEFESVVSEIVRHLDADAALKDLANAHRTYQPTGKYAPTEYRLKLEYQRLLGKLNHEFPRGARIPIQRLPLDLRRERLTQEAREAMAEFEKSFAERFPSTGYKTYEEYEAAIRNSTDPRVHMAISMIEKGQIQVAIRRPESGRFWVPKVGFQNQYVTGSSKGFLGHEKRQQAEDRLLDVGSKNDYAGLDTELMPKYATFRPAPASGVTYSSIGSSQYGPDFYVLRLSDIQDRLSWTPGDSLNVGWVTSPITEWKQTFIPWRYRLLMVEFMKEGLAKNAMYNPSQGEKEFRHSLYNQYWETQILGPIDLKNVESFHFTRTPPSGKFLEDLQKATIPIYDARVWPPVEWKPEK
jgi:hypothetical protein